MRRLGYAWLLLVLTGACEPDLEPVRTGRVIINAPRELDHADKARDEIRSAVRGRLDEDETVELVKGDRDVTHVVHLNISPVMPVPEVAREREKEKREAQAPLFRPVEIRLEPRKQVPAFEVVGRGTDEPDPVASVMAGFDDAWRVLQRHRKLERSDDDALIDALDAGDARIRDFAIRRLGARKARAAVKPLCDRLTEEKRPELVLRTIGSLVAIGDEAAVEPLIELTRRKDPAFVLQIIFAVGAIGGRTAEAFLVTLASGHPSPQVQRGAKDALEEMPR